MKRSIYIVLALFLSVMTATAQTQSCDNEGVEETMSVQRSENKSTVSFFDNVLFVSNVPENSIVEVKNMLGGTVFSSQTTSNNSQFQLNLKKGFYVVRVADESQRDVIDVQRFVVK